MSLSGKQPRDYHAWRRALAGVAIVNAELAAEDARRRDDEDAYRDALARMETARARWRELTDEGGAS